MIATFVYAHKEALTSTRSWAELFCSTIECYYVLCSTRGVLHRECWPVYIFRELSTSYHTAVVDAHWSKTRGPGGGMTR